MKVVLILSLDCCEYRDSTELYAAWHEMLWCARQLAKARAVAHGARVVAAELLLDNASRQYFKCLHRERN